MLCGGTEAARQVRNLIQQALSRNGAPRTTSQRLAAEGHILAVEAAYGCGPELRLGTQVTTA